MNHDRAGSVQQRHGLAGELSGERPPAQRDQQPQDAQGMPPHEPTALAPSPAAHQASLKTLKAGAPSHGALAGPGDGMAAAGSGAQAAEARQAAAGGAVAAGAPDAGPPSSTQPAATGSTPAAVAGLTQAGAAAAAQQQQSGGVATPAAAPQAATPAASPPTAQRQAGAAGPAAAAAAAEAEAAALMPPPPPSPAQQAVADLDALIQRLAALDPDGWFRHPVRESDAPNYYKIIRRPMCFEVGAARSVVKRGCAAGAGMRGQQCRRLAVRCRKCVCLATLAAPSCCLMCGGAPSLHGALQAGAHHCSHCRPPMLTCSNRPLPCAAVHARQGAGAAVRHVAGAGARL